MESTKDELTKKSKFSKSRAFLNQACAWFLKIDRVRIVGLRVRVCACVCLHPRLLITSGVIWHDMNLIRLVNKFYSCYMATVVVSLMGVALALIRVVDTDPLRVS